MCMSLRSPFFLQDFFRMRLLARKYITRCRDRMQRCWGSIYYNVGGELDISHHIIVILECSMCAIFSLSWEWRFLYSYERYMLCVWKSGTAVANSFCWIFNKMLQCSVFVLNFWCCICILWENLFWLIAKFVIHVIQIGDVISEKFP
jgi:hypothetical protein